MAKQEINIRVNIREDDKKTDVFKLQRKGSDEHDGHGTTLQDIYGADSYKTLKQAKKALNDIIELETEIARGEGEGVTFDYRFIREKIKIVEIIKGGK